MPDLIQGTVKWFSNKKGFGFITPLEGQSISEDVFVHQSSVTSDGFRSLGDGWQVEFLVGKDENGRPKADNVTGIGGGPCVGPKSTTNKRGQRTRVRKKKNKPPQETWHDSLSDEVKDTLKMKGVRMSTGTVDVALANWRIKLGSGGYCSCAHASKMLAEGEFSSSDSGDVALTWNKCISFLNEKWVSADTGTMLCSLSLLDESIKAIGEDETAQTLWGSEPSDPAVALETNGFKMRRVVLTAKPRRQEE